VLGKPFSNDFCWVGTTQQFPYKVAKRTKIKEKCCSGIETLLVRMCGHQTSIFFPLSFLLVWRVSINLVGKVNFYTREKRLID